MEFIVNSDNQELDILDIFDDVDLLSGGSTVETADVTASICTDSPVFDIENTNDLGEVVVPDGEDNQAAISMSMLMIFLSKD
jgi:hypothetical protein